MTLLALIQANGERIPVEQWLYDSWARGQVTDPDLLRFLNGAVEIRPFGWPRTPGEEERAERERRRIQR